MTEPTPDLKPQLPPLAPGTECCDCCDGIKTETPQTIWNRGGLSTISYRIGDYARFDASLRAALSLLAFPQLAGLKTRDADDFTIGLFDAFSCAADVLTFYQERIANESWLRTAVERVSLQEMGKLVGYQLRPGIAAETMLAFTVETPPAPPANLPADPGGFVTGVPDSIVLAAGLQVQSIPGPGEVPQSFELVEPLAEARPAWNALRAWMSEPAFPGAGEREAWLAGVATGLKAGDGVLLVGGEYLADGTSDAWDFRVVSAVEADAAQNRTRITWGRGLGSAYPHSDPAKQPQIYALRRRAAVFGNNAPLWASMDQGFKTGYLNKFDPPATDTKEWPNFVVSPVAANASSGAVDLDQLLPDISADVSGDSARRSFAVLAKGGFNRPDESFPSGTYVELYRVTGTTEVSRAEFALSAKVLRLALAGENLDTQFAGFVRETSVFAKSDLLPLAERPVTTAVSGDTVPVAASADGLLPGRRLIIRGTQVSDGQAVTIPATLVAVHVVDAGRTELEISPPLAQPLDRASLVVYANVALASHGESVTQILGAGNAAQPFQQFELKQLPLTWRAATNELGAAAELTVRVGDIAWERRSTLYGAAPTDRAYALATDEQGRQWVRFGDGLRGARLPSGPNNVRANYRKGIGQAGNVAADKLTQLLSRPLGLKGVSNPLAAEGGTDPEPADAARDTIPLTTRTLGRAVSILDYEDFARAFGGIAKAQAQVLRLRNGTIIAVTIAAADGAAITPASPVWQNLLAALKAGGDPYVQVALFSAQQNTFRLGIRVKCDPAYEAKTVLAAVDAALRAHFAFDARALGQPVQQSDVIAVAQGVAGVVAVDLTRLYGGTQPSAQTMPSLQVRLLAQQMHVAAGVAIAAELLTLDPAPFDALEEMA